MRGELCPFDHGNDPVVVQDMLPPGMLGFPASTGPNIISFLMANQSPRQHYQGMLALSLGIIPLQTPNRHPLGHQAHYLMMVQNPKVLGKVLIQLYL